MSEGPTGSDESVPEVVVEERRRSISPIWLIPLVAIVVAGAVAYDTYTSRGPSIVIVFESGETLVAERYEKFRRIGQFLDGGA